MIDWRSLPPLTAVRALGAVAETGSVVRAGQVLNVSHAAISQQIKALETFVGVPLVDRSGREIALTQQGRLLADAALRGFQDIARETATIMGLDADRPLQITTTQLFATGWLMPRLSRFTAQHPEINLMINPTPQLVNPEPGRVDMGLRFGSGDWPGFDTELLVPSDTAVVAAPDLIGDDDITSLQCLARYPWLKELGLNDVTDWLQKHAISYDKLHTLEMPGNLILDAARRGQGLMIGSYTNVEEDVKRGRLKVLFRDHGDTGYFIVTPPGVLRPQTRTFIKWLRGEAALSQT